VQDFTIAGAFWERHKGVVKMQARSNVGSKHCTELKRSELTILLRSEGWTKLMN